MNICIFSHFSREQHPLYNCGHCDPLDVLRFIQVSIKSSPHPPQLSRSPNTRSKEHSLPGIGLESRRASPSSPTAELTTGAVCPGEERCERVCPRRQQHSALSPAAAALLPLLAPAPLRAASPQHLRPLPRLAARAARPRHPEPRVGPRSRHAAAVASAQGWETSGCQSTHRGRKEPPGDPWEEGRARYSKALGLLLRSSELGHWVSWGVLTTWLATVRVPSSQPTSPVWRSRFYVRNINMQHF